MDNPEYTVKQINVQLAKRTALPVTVWWAGDETAEIPNLEVHLGEDATAYTVDDLDHVFDVTRQTGPRHYTTIGGASGYAAIADLLATIITEDIAAGVLSLPEEEN